MCERWNESFEAFLADMGPCPIGFSLDRIDVNGPYSPENCRWASPLTQANNARTNHRVTFNGQTLTVSQWERHLGFNPGTMKRRLLLGWSEEKALTTPLLR